MLTALNPFDSNQPFPDAAFALDDPNGLLAVGGCLSTRRLLNAYRRGIFPWFSSEEPILWWSPDPRLVLFPERLHVSRSLRKTMKNDGFEFSFDRCFAEVIDACAQPRAYASDTWISPAVKQAFCQLHEQGFTHSFEAWKDGDLVGGLYGLALGQVFFGESMFHTETDASKAAFAFAVDRLHAWGYRLVDCQVHTNHLESLGAEEIPRAEFVRLLDDFCEQASSPSAWLQQRGLP
jgi:leucyl/phenylalanyl-tRNA--protein transferase